MTNILLLAIVKYLLVQATEMTNNMRHNSTDIEITILDINDNYPVFDRLQYNISINETTPLHTVTILTVTATDPDEVCHLL